jgi:hypothetical protein
MTLDDAAQSLVSESAPMRDRPARARIGLHIRSLRNLDRE